MKHKTIYGMVALAVLGLLMLSACSPRVNQADKRKCENSGGSYETGVSESGTFRLCACPITKYESNFECKTITSTEISKCTLLSNSNVDCTNAPANYEYFNYYDEGVCQCTFKSSGTISYFTYSQLINSNCQCTEDGCGCMGGAVQR